MKKIFTSISMALCLAASSFNASAQQATQLSDAQKQEIQQKVLPVVFEQIKEQAGIDIFGWAQPKLTADYLGSLPGFSTLKSDNGLRAANDINIQPDSVKLDMTKLNLNPAIAAMLGELTIKFQDPQTRTIPLVGILLGYDIIIGAPETISVVSSVLGEVVTIDITLTGEDGVLTPFGMEMVISSNITQLGLNKTPLLNFTMDTNEETSLIEANVDIRSGLRTLWGLLNGLEVVPSLPNDDYLITIDMYNILSGNLALSLYGYPDDSTDENSRVSMGDAVVALDIAALLGKTGMPLKYIDITSYDTEGEENEANNWSRLDFKMNQANEQDLVLTIDNFVYSDANREYSVNPYRYTITMSDYTAVTDVESAANTVVQRVVSQLANEGEVAPYVMSISATVDTNGDGMLTIDDATNPVMDVNVTPSETGATINIQSYANGETSTVDLTVTTGRNEDDEEIISMDIAKGDAVIGSVYFTSNVWGAITDNEEIQLANVEVTPVKDGIYVSGTTAASYRIVSMSGATVANGTVSGDNAYISTSALAKGIYVIVVTENGESKAIKFAR